MKINHINQVGGALKRCVLGLAVGAAVVFGAGQSAHAATITQTYDLGTSPSGTMFNSSGYGSLFIWIAQGSLPAGSILRSVSVTNLAIVGDNNGNWASDLGVYVDPTPGTDNGDGLLRISDDGDFGGAAASINYQNQGQNDGPLTLTLSAPADFPATIDLSTAAVMLGSAYNPGMYSGTVTVEYDIPEPAVILSFGGSPGGSIVIDQGAKTIVWSLPVGTDVTGLAPTYTLTTGVCVPASGSPHDFTSPVTYTVTAAGVITNIYTVTVQLLAFSGKVNVNFTGAARTGLGGPRGDSGEAWNQLNWSGSLTSIAGGGNGALWDSAGVPTTIGVSYTTDSPGLDEWNSGTLTLQLIRDGLRNFPNGSATGETITITNLPAGRKYDVYIASANASGGESSDGVFSTTNTTTPVSLPCVNTGVVNGTDWVSGNNYVLFTNVMPNASGTITITGTNTPNFRLPINGFQVVDVGSAVATPPIVTVTTITGPVASEFTIHGSTDIAGNVVTEKTASLSAPIIWVPFQTNAVPGGIFGIVVPQGVGTQAFYRLVGQ